MSAPKVAVRPSMVAVGACRARGHAPPLLRPLLAAAAQETAVLQLELRGLARRQQLLRPLPLPPAAQQTLVQELVQQGLLQQGQARRLRHPLPPLHGCERRPEARQATAHSPDAVCGERVRAPRQLREMVKRRPQR